MGKRKILTKAASFILALVMIVSMVPELAMNTKASGNAVTLYFKLPDGTTVGDWGVNAWASSGSFEKVEANNEVKMRPSSWGDGDQYPTLLSKDGLDGWGYVKITGSIAGIDFVNMAGVEHKCWNAKIAEDSLTEAYYNPADKKWYKEAGLETEIPFPEIQETFILAGDSGLAGSNWSIADENNFLTKVDDTTKYSITFKGVAKGNYSYKILQDPANQSWELPFGDGNNRSVEVKAPADVTFTIDTTDDAKKVEVTQKLIQDIVVSSGNIIKGKETELETSAKYYDGNSETPADVTITYALESPVQGVTLNDNKITVDSAAAITSIAVVASYSGFDKKITIPVVDKEYTVNIYMYSQDLEMTPGVSDIYIYEDGGSNKVFMDLTKTYEDTENNVTWVGGTVKIPFTKLGIIARDKAGSWDDGQDGNQYYEIDPDVEEITLWYEYGKTPTTEKPTITWTAQRWFYLEYENKTATDTPQFSSWTTGYKQELIDFEKQSDGNYLVKVKVKPSCTKVDFVIALDASGEPWLKDGGDHSISFPLEQTVVCAKMKEGEEPELSAPYNTGYELQPKENQISFYYRDDEALIDGTLADLEPKVEIDGMDYPMTYNEADKRFVYVKQGLENGRIHYRYHVGEEYILDQYNENKETKETTEYSYVDYYKLSADISAEVMNPSFNYNENNVVRFEVNQTQKEADIPEIEVEKASIDVSSLGGSKDMPIEPELQAVAISATTDTALGKKTLPVVVTDQFNNEYTTTVDVTVAKREKAANDFDWDEACIYFMVTDRFFDGNAGNNTASDSDLPTGVTSTYGKENPGLYHGGDFAGVTKKLDYLKNLGINTIWITPIVENIPGVKVTDEGSEDVPFNAAYHGYWASDFTKLNPTMGTESEFKALISEAHKRGIKIMVDIVVNHAGYDTLDTFGDMIRTREDVVAGDDQRDSLSDLPDFKTEDPDVRAKLVEWQTNWMKNYGIDYYRVDTVKHVEGTTWAALKNSVTAVNPSFKMIGEYSGAGYASNGGSLGSGQMDSDLDFDFNDQATNFVSGNISEVEKFLTGRNATLNNTYLTGQFLGSHDEIGFKQNLIDNKEMNDSAATAASLVAATLQITAKGQPVIYYGEEVGQTGENVYPYQTNRYDFDWSKATDSNVTYKHYKKLLTIRKSYVDVFARGDRTVVDSNDKKGYDIVKRTYGNNSLWIGMNIKDENQTVKVSGMEAKAVYQDLYSGKNYTADAKGDVSIALPKSSEGGTVILVKGKAGQEPTTEAPKTEKPTTQTPASEVKVTKLTISGPSKKLAAGKKVKLSVKAQPSDAANKAVTWKTSNKKYATIDQKGKLTLKKAGAGKKVTVTATAKDGSGVKATYKIQIMKNAVKKVKLKASKKTVKAGKTLKIKATVSTTGKKVNKTLKWTSSNTKYATVSKKGVVKAKKAGKGKKVTITATATDGSNKKAKIKIKIK